MACGSCLRATSEEPIASSEISASGLSNLFLLPSSRRLADGRVLPFWESGPGTQHEPAEWARRNGVAAVSGEQLGHPLTPEPILSLLLELGSQVAGAMLRILLPPLAGWLLMDYLHRRHGASVIIPRMCVQDCLGLLSTNKQSVLRNSSIEASNTLPVSPYPTGPRQPSPG